MFGLPGGFEWIIILFAIILLNKEKKIPELMKGLGSGIKEFKKASSVEASDEQKEKQKLEEEKKES